MIKLHISNFWPSFDYTNNFFVELFKDIYNQDVIFTNINDCNLCLIADCNIPPELDKTKTKTICFTGEPKKIDFSLCDYYFTFDPDFEKNVRLPLWNLYINYYKIKNNKNLYNPILVEKIKNNEWSEKEKIHFCVAPFSVMEKHRTFYFNLLNTYKKTDGFGSPFGNGDPEKDEVKKYNKISDYKFCMSFENTDKLGYVTEKLFQAKVAGCIPIYWGNKLALQDFNPKSFIYVNNFSTLEESLNYVKYIDSSEEEFKKIKNEPLFLIDPKTNLENIKIKIKNMINV